MCREERWWKVGKPTDLQFQLHCVTKHFYSARKEIIWSNPFLLSNLFKSLTPWGIVMSERMFAGAVPRRIASWVAQNWLPLTSDRFRLLPKVHFVFQERLFSLAKTKSEDFWPLFSSFRISINLLKRVRKFFCILEMFNSHITNQKTNVCRFSFKR